MTLEEKASLISGKNFWESCDIKRLDIPSMFLADGPHGIRRQIKAADHLGLNKSIKATCYPAAAAIANSWDVSLAEKQGELLGQEAAVQKVNVLLGPGLNIKRNPLCGRNFEYFSEDPYLTGVMAAAYIKGIQKEGIAACPKHFAANNQETRRMAINTIVDERTLREIYLTAFEIAVKEGGAAAVMTSYNRLNGQYTNENKHLLINILRKAWKYEGVIITDWGGCNDRIEALRCSQELEMPGNGEQTSREVIKAVKQGTLKESYLDEALTRLLKLIFSTNEAVKNISTADLNNNSLFALKAAQESIILLKNNDNILPLKKGAKVSVIGDFAKTPRYQGAGSSAVNPYKLNSVIECIKEYDLEFTGFQKGYKRFGGKSRYLQKRACALAEKSDFILLFIGLSELDETEGIDRKSMKLAENQLDLIAQLKKTGKKIIAVLSSGSVIEMNWTDYTDAVIHTSLCGQEGARAALNVLTGIVNPSGKLTESYPYYFKDCPSYSNFPGKEMTVEYREGIYVGYRYYEKNKINVKYPFGFGLSYTTFKYSDIFINNEGATFTLKNTGNKEGSEIVQLYISAIGSKIFRPLKELKGFTKVFLQPGKEKRVYISFNEYTFRYYNIISQRWEKEPCEYEVLIGASSDDIRLKECYVIKEDIFQLKQNTPVPYIVSKLPSYYSGNVANVSEIEFEQLYGKKPPESSLPFIKNKKKKRIITEINTLICDLHYAQGWFGRFTAFFVKTIYDVLHFLGKHKQAFALYMGVYNTPVRSLSRMSAGLINMEQAGGLIMMFNGNFFSGLNRIIKMMYNKKNNAINIRTKNEKDSINNIMQNDKKKIRVAFLFVEAGLGHIMPMTAAADVFEKKYGDKTEIIRTYFYKDTHDPDMKYVEDELIREVKIHNSNKIHGFLQFFFLKLLGTQFCIRYVMQRRYKRGYEKSLEYLKKLDADVLFSTHFATLYTACEAKRLGIINSKIAAYCPDPVIGLQWDSRADIFTFSGKIRKSYKKRFSGLSSIPFLIRKEVEDLKESKAHYRKSLGFPENDFLILLSDGAYGAGKIQKTAELLLKSPLKLSIAAVCGKNDKIKTHLENLDVPCNITFKVFGFTDKTLELAAACDLFIGKAGASSIAEPVYFGSPAIVTLRATPVEKWICSFYEEAGCAICVENAKKAVILANKFAGDPSKMEELKKACVPLKKSDGPENLADLLWNIL